MNNVALYICADPFTFNDLDLVKKSISMFGFINIFLDRKNRDSENDEFTLNYDNRSEIIKHDLKQLKITNYKIVPVDETLKKSLEENDISTLILNFSYQKLTDFRMYKIISELNPNVNIILLRGHNYIESKFIQTLLNADSSMTIYKKYCSEYAFMKLKIKSMQKIGLTGSIGSDYEKAIETFKDRGYSIVDLSNFIRNIQFDKKSISELEKIYAKNDIFIGNINNNNIVHECAINKKANDIFQKYIFEKVNQIIIDEIKKTFSDKVVIVFELLCEFGLDQMMDKNICIKTKEDDVFKRLAEKGYSIDYINDLSKIQMDLEDELDICDYQVEEDDDFCSSLVRLINTKLK